MTKALEKRTPATAMLHPQTPEKVTATFYDFNPSPPASTRTSATKRRFAAALDDAQPSIYQTPTSKKIRFGDDFDTIFDLEALFLRKALDTHYVLAIRSLVEGVRTLKHSSLHFLTLFQIREALGESHSGTTVYLTKADTNKIFSNNLPALFEALSRFSTSAPIMDPQDMLQFIATSGGTACCGGCVAARTTSVDTILKAAHKLRFPAAEVWLDILCLGNVQGSLNRDLSEVVRKFKTTFSSTEVGKAVKTQMRAAILQKKQTEFNKLCANDPGIRGLFAAVRELVGPERVKKYGLEEENCFMEDESLSLSDEE